MRTTTRRRVLGSALAGVAGLAASALAPRLTLAKAAEPSGNSEIVHAALSDSLHLFQGAGGNVVSVTLDNFENQFSLGFFSGEATATIGMQVTVKRPDGSVAYDKYFTGQSKDWVEIAGEDNAGRQLNAAMQDGVSKIFDDSAFIDSLRKS